MTAPAVFPWIISANTFSSIPEPELVASLAVLFIGIQPSHAVLDGVKMGQTIVVEECEERSAMVLRNGVRVNKRRVKITRASFWTSKDVAAHATSEFFIW